MFSGLLTLLPEIHANYTRTHVQCTLDTAHFQPGELRYFMCMCPQQIWRQCTAHMVCHFISLPPCSFVINHGKPQCIILYVHVHTRTCIYVHVHEQSYYIVHYIRRKEEGKEGRKKRTNTNNLQQPQRLRENIYMCTHSQLQQLRKNTHSHHIRKIYTHPQPHQLRKIYKPISGSVA